MLALGSRRQSLLQRNGSQAIDISEIAVAADQCRAERESRRGYLPVVFVQSEAALLAGCLDSRVEAVGPLRHGFAAKHSQELAAGLLQLRPPSTRWQPGDPEKHFASNDRARNHTVAMAQTSHPAFDSRGGPHQIADRILVQQIGHAGGHLSKAP